MAEINHNNNNNNNNNGVREEEEALQGAEGAAAAVNVPWRPLVGAHVVANDNEGGDAAARNVVDVVEEAADEDEDEAPIGQSDSSRRMALSEEERGWAIAIKKAIEADPDLESLTDFLYVQIALIHKEDVTGAIERAHKLQCFRQEYGMETEDFESSQRYLHELVLLFPGYLLSVSFNEAEGSYVVVMDMARFLAQKVNSIEGAMRTYMCAMYVLMHACCPDFESIRRGLYSVSENEGFCWKTNFGLKIYKTFWVDLAKVYPMRIQKMKSYHTGVFVNVINSMSRSFLPNEIMEKFQLGCICEQGRLDALFLTPNAREATEKMLNEANDILLMRYANEESFKL